jgi:hypothetical protein
LARAPDVLQSILTAAQETKHARIVQIGVGALHRLVQNGAVDAGSYSGVLDALQVLTDAALEEIKVLQCILSLVTQGELQGAELARACVLCLRLHFAKDVTTAAVAAATLRQVVVAVFERVVAEDELRAREGADAAPRAPAAGDAYLLFQDLCLLTNGESPHWLSGLEEMTRTFGLELIETALSTHPPLFFQHAEFGFLLKEHVCSLIIKLFSPGIKHAGKAPALLFPVTIRLLRVTLLLIERYSALVMTESEIFLSMLAKLLEPNKLMWQRVTSLEVRPKRRGWGNRAAAVFPAYVSHFDAHTNTCLTLSPPPKVVHTICKQPRLLLIFFQRYDMELNSSNVFRDLVGSRGLRDDTTGRPCRK